MSITRLKKMLDKSKKIIQNNIIEDLLDSGPMSRINDKEMQYYTGVNWNHLNYICIIMEVDNFHNLVLANNNEIQYITEILKNIVENTENSWEHIFAINSKQNVSILICSKFIEISDVRIFIERVKEYYVALSDITVTTGIGNCIKKEKT